LDVESRAQMHAALGEPVRLAAAEHLLLTDASPGELSATLGLSSNLMAHHLGVLENAGLIRRVRSEGDGRRSYLQLRLDVPEVAALFVPANAVATRLGRPPRVVFVCTHNSARSQLAAATWAHLSDTPVRSAGTHPAARVHPRAVKAAKRHGLGLAHARTAYLRDVVESSDLVISVCDNAFEELAGVPSGRPSLHWAVPDPVAESTDAAFEAAYEQIHRRVEQLAVALEATRTS
jgi:ArsR family transcriptional regulator, arsenate/arsenite/antimonite-responsive transcriptional repressor / arsenate reductase (thioredoxin)